ncbi:alpha/beta-hydrolase [Trematosphaeria pertusa]|uniref:Carboxylic ester hydrolase n=1 Tax=Trematosphaeria pertusa TaxID=390896 RepID=A0A6A6ID23_9PLEO|nr:alpha/beta-hydrolase [Trematosphaeria pertusa]KAF2248291.1 alpha/beta-hydrolase [Trematosphaeria pertusa]
MSSPSQIHQRRARYPRPTSLDYGSAASAAMAATPRRAESPTTTDDASPPDGSIDEPLLPVDESPREHVGFRKRYPGPSGPVLEVPSTPLLVALPGYSTFKGVRVLTSLNRKMTFEEPVDAWLGVEYSRQPVNESRFAPPDWPEPFNGTKDATDYGPICVQAWSNPTTHSEACLTFNLYRPAGIQDGAKLPVFVFLHGGAFVEGSGKSFDGATFVAKSQEPLIVVTVQYRIGALGSLPSKLFEEEGLLNLGVRDQRMLLEFTQKYVSYFGGDPERITLGGQSAGAHSVGIHLFHNYGDDEGKKLFSQAILASGAPTARSFPAATYPLYERQFQRFMDYLDCPISPNSEALSCLRNASVSSIQYISKTVFKDSKYNITWPWQPASPGPLLEKRGSKSGEDGTFYKIPTLISSTTDEGKFFAPKNLSTGEEFTAFVANMLPGLTDDDLADLDALYPDPSNGTGPYADHTGAFQSTQFERIGAAYGDYSYICPVQETARLLAAAGAPVYKARFNTPNYASAHMGVPHASDAPYFNGVTDVESPDISEIYSSYYASFIVSGDPNKYAVEGAPVWDRYWGVGSGELAVGSEERGGVVMEEERAGIRMVECRWWRDPERMRRLNK